MHNIQISPKLCSEDIYYVGYTARECYKPSGLRPYVLLDIDKNSMEIYDLIQNKNQLPWYDRTSEPK